jgi:hypothetical protein
MRDAWYETLWGIMIVLIGGIEQLRADIAGLDPAQAEDVIGQATKWNRQIASAKATNQIPIIEWIIPDAVNSINPIAIPKKAERQ